MLHTACIQEPNNAMGVGNDCIAVMDIQSGKKYNQVMKCGRQSNVSRLQNIVCHKQKTCRSQKLRLWYRIPQVVFAFSLTSSLIKPISKCKTTNLSIPFTKNELFLFG